MNDVRKKDIIAIIVITLVLFIITELYVAFNGGISTIIDNSIVFGIFLAVSVSLIIFFLCRKFNIKVKKNKINNIVFWSISACIIIYRFVMFGYVEYKINSINEMIVKLENYSSSANNFRELLDILKLTQKEEEILNSYNEEAIGKISNMDSTLMNGGWIVCTYDAWKLLSQLRALAIQNIWSLGSTYGFGEAGYQKFIKKNGYPVWNYEKAADNIIDSLNSEVSTIIIIPTICEIVISAVLLRVIKQED